MHVTFIIATKDRPADLSKTLHSLAAQSVHPSEVIIVDGGSSPVRSVVSDFDTQLPINYFHHTPPSASAQRNEGIRALSPQADLAGFLDDDATLEPTAMEQMLAFWQGAPADIGGCAFNLINPPRIRSISLKRTWLAETLGLYSARAGIVMQSGWHTMIGTVRATTFVDWLPSTAVMWRASIIRTSQFDEFYTGYSYLEDLDFSFSLRSQWRLAVVANAQYKHTPSPLRHFDGFGFGRTEIRNRLYFVRKHSLSVARCWIAIAGRLGMTLSQALAYVDAEALHRALGNVAEIKSLLHE